jgi:hypothetical protein
MSDKSRLRPVLDGEFWMIGDNPDLGPLQGNTDPARGPVQECVDHHVFRSADGAWHLWGCIRNTAVGRVLYHWEADRLADRHWRRTGEMIRADRPAGECLRESDGKEWLQSPYVVRNGGTYYMFYGGHCTGLDAEGKPAEAGNERNEGQVCLMTSPDGRRWTRHDDGEGRSRVFIGPGETRDPCLIRIGGLWHIYYAGYHDGRRANPGYYLRTSEDLLCWSNWELVHQDFEFGAGSWNTECPHVVERGGRLYLFRTEDYASRKSHVFRSTDPHDFGVGDASEHYVCPFPVAAPEMVVDAEGSEYITSNHNLAGGTMICRLAWKEV